MGVQGWTKLLVEEGWLPDYYNNFNSSCRTSLWRDDSEAMVSMSMIASSPSSSSALFGSRVQALPSHSTFHIDGNGLAFYLHQVAYARHIEKVVSETELLPQQSSCRIKTTTGKKRGCCCCASPNNLSPTQVRRLLPSFLPLSLLSEVTKEYITSLQRHKMSIIVYWDGPRRRVFKHDTDVKRQHRMHSEWSNLQQYCEHGVVMPNVNSVCQWDKNHQFPKTRLFLPQILHTLKQQCCGVEMVHCEEEADAVIARAASGDPRAFVLANDSDFCFFPDVNYIPFVNLDASSNSRVTACVLRRDCLAQSLGLACEDAMVELAILSGNDYLVDPESSRLDFYDKEMEACLDHLCSQDEGYRVTSVSEDREEILCFIRELYGLGDLSDFPFDDDDDKVGEGCCQENERNVLNRKNDAGSSSGLRPSFPADVDLSLAKVRPLVDDSIKSAVIRCLQAYLDNQSLKNGDSSHCLVITQEHVDMFRSMTMKETVEDLVPNTWRPNWGDVSAVYVIERTIAMALELNAGCPLMRFCSPFTLFDQYRYHALLYCSRQSDSLPVAATPSVPLTLSLPPAVPVEPESVERVQLPVDEHEARIMETVNKNRITIIQGETGCGKSSRIPVMLLKAPPPDKSLKQVKLFISQPRRIGAKALVERLRSVEPDLRDCIALRMGHGVREYESSKTRVWFVTTGYLVRLLANHPERFDDISHLIIDEVHERSVDTDILCLLCRRLLKTNHHIRLILMSATLAASLYQEYFNVPEPSIKVGARRFPVEEVFIEEFCSRFALPPKVKKAVGTIEQECAKMRCTKEPSMHYMEKLYVVVTHLAMIVGHPGSSVLVFVPGMNDIVAISEMIEQLYVPGVRFTCFPIHSDIPFEDQMSVFNASDVDEVKIIIATNAAESSVTLPEVDHVICLGLCKQIVYNQMSHRQMLLPTWISRASATQRAGRTGRLRPGTVYRLYTRVNYEQDMDSFEPGEMVRIPLDSVILMLKEMLTDEEVTAVLLDCLEPPDIATIDRSFESLFRSKFITTPDDSCEITTLGSFVSALGIDLALGQLLGLGIQYGVAAEALQMAAILSFPKTPWIISSPLVHEAEEYNEMVKKTFMSRSRFDAGLFSEPLATMNLLWEYEHTRQKAAWCWRNGLAAARVKRLSATCANLRKRVADFFDIDEAVLAIETPPSHLPHALTNVLRVIQAWVFNETIVECRPKQFLRGHSNEGHTLELSRRSDIITEDHLEQVICNVRHPCTLVGYTEIRQKGTFDLPEDAAFSVHAAMLSLQQRFLSYAIEKGFSLVWFWDKECGAVYVSDKLLSEDKFSVVLEKLRRSKLHESSIVVVKEQSGIRRGISERPCGQWNIREDTSFDGKVDARIFGKFEAVLMEQKELDSLFSRLTDYIKAHHSVKGLACGFSPRRNVSKKQRFSLCSYGQGGEVSKKDLQDLLAAAAVQLMSTKVLSDKQKLVFHAPSDSSLEHGVDQEGEDSTTKRQTTSWERPLLHCIPEGARLLSVLASGRRREHLVRLSSIVSESDEEQENKQGETLDIHLDPSQTKLSTRWKRMNSDMAVYVNENSIPATALPANDTTNILYCCASNTLEVKGGGLRAEGLTLLPPGRLFLLLCRISFGLIQSESLEDDTFEQKCIVWLAHDAENDVGTFAEDWRRRIRMALCFHESAMNQGEELVCFPSKVRELNAIFDGVDGYGADPWDIDSNPFTLENLTKWKHAYKRIASAASLDMGGYRDASDALSTMKSNGLQQPGREMKTLIAAEEVSENSEDDFQREAECILAATSHLDKEAEEQAAQQKRKKKKRGKRDKDNTNQSNCLNENIILNGPSLDALAVEADTVEKLVCFEDNILEASRRLFAVDLPDNHEIGDHELPSTNILALVVQYVRRSLRKGRYDYEMNIEDGLDWEIYRVTAESRVYYQATFTGRDLRETGRGDRRKGQTNWLFNPAKKRPCTVEDALDCLPDMYRDRMNGSLMVVSILGSNSLVFESVEVALRMEAAFWMERRFRTREQHWFQQGIEVLIERLEKDCRG